MVHTLAQQRGLLATFMPKPFTHLTGNGCHFHMSLWDGDRNVFLDRGRPARPRALGARLPLHRRAEGATRRAYIAAHRADGQLVQAAERRRADERRHLVAGVRSRYGYNNRTQMLRDPGCRAASRTARSTARATRTSRRRPCSRPVSTGSRTGSTRASRTPATCTRRRSDELRRRGIELLPANLLDATRELERTMCCARRSAAAATRTTSTTTSASSATSGRRYHEQVTAWELKQYLTRF